MRIVELRTTAWGVIFAAAMIAPGAAAEMFRWTDEDGNVVFSDRRPVDETRNLQTFNVRSGKASSAAVEKLQAGLKKDAARREEAGKVDARVKAEQAQADAKHRNCELARDKLSRLVSNPRVFSVDMAGNRTRLSEEERQDRITKAREMESEYCG